MKRTTIFIPEKLHEELRQEAFHRRISMAELIRSRLERKGVRRRQGRPKTDPLLQVAGIISDGKLSQGIDAAVYGI